MAGKRLSMRDVLSVADTLKKRGLKVEIVPTGERSYSAAWHVRVSKGDQWVYFKGGTHQVFDYLMGILFAISLNTD